MRKTGILLASVIGACLPLHAFAQEPAPGETIANNDGDIVVTARKRSETAQSVPLSITALDGAALARQNIATLGDIRSAPNVELSPISVNPSGLVTFIRGVGNRAQEPNLDVPVAVSIDGVYLAQSTGALIDLFDVQQVEVLRGPQGTLQGRNSPGGAINVTTRRPSGETGFEGQLGYGRFNAYEVKVAAETALVPDTLAVRASLLVSGDDGQVRNLTTGKRTGGRDIRSGRLSLLFTPSSDFDLFVSGDYTQNRSDQTGLRSANVGEAFPRQPVSAICAAFGICTPAEPYTTRSNYTAPYRANLGGVSATANLHFGGATLTSVTGYRFLRETQNADLDGEAIPLLAVENRKFHLDTFSQELRIASDKGGGLDFGGRLDWLLGAIYYKSKFDFVQPATSFGSLFVQDGDQHLLSRAVFGQATVHLTDAWSVSGGFRQTWDRKRYNGVPSGFPESSRVFVRGHWSNFSFEAGTEYKLSRQVLAYARFAQGYRSGGINANAANPADVGTFDPETVDSYEIGLKSEWLDRKLTVNLALFNSDYKDLQRDIVKPSNTGQGFAQIVENAASARIRGIELETVVRPTSRLNGRFSLGYLHAKYRKFLADLVGDGVVTDNSDLRLPYTPHYTLSGGVDYTLPFADGSKATASATVSHKTGYSVQPLDVPVGDQQGFSLVNLSLRYDFAGQHLGLQLYADNVFDKHYIIAGEPAGGALRYQVDGMRRTFGGRLFAKF